MSNFFIKVLRNSSIYSTYEAALAALKTKLGELSDGEICLTSYGDDWDNTKSIFGFCRVNGEKRSYTIYEPFSIQDIKLGNGLALDDDGNITITIDSASDDYLTVGKDGLKLSGVKTIIEDHETRIGVLEAGATKDTISISAANVSNGSVELTGTSALSSTITVSGKNEYFNGKNTTIDVTKLSLFQGSTEITLTEGKATVTLPSAANSSVTYTGRMIESTTANSPTITFRMYTRMYARFDEGDANLTVDSFINSTAGNTSAASNAVASGLASSVAQTLIIPINGTGKKYVYVAVPSSLTLKGSIQPDSLNAPFPFTDTNKTITKSLGGATQTWKIYKSDADIDSSATKKLTFN